MSTQPLANPMLDDIETATKIVEVFAQSITRGEPVTTAALAMLAEACKQTGYHDELCHYHIFEDAREIIKLKDARIEAEKARINEAVLADAAQLNELVRSTRLAALREAYHAAAGAHRGPVGASDGGTYICGTNADAASAIQKLIDEASK